MKTIAVIDTNVIVSALLSHNSNSATVQVLQAVMDGRIKILHHPDILREYQEVLMRPKFKFNKESIEAIVSFLTKTGLSTERTKTTEDMADPKDIVFYEVTLSNDDAYLVTGNLKHFPHKPIVISPKEMIEILASK